MWLQRKSSLGLVNRMEGKGVSIKLSHLEAKGAGRVSQHAGGYVPSR